MDEGRTLVIGPAWVGDMVMAHSLLQILKAREPQRPIDVIAPAATSVLLTRMPEVADAVLLDIGHGELGLLKRLGLGWNLRQRRYKQAFILPGSYKAALPAWTSRAKRRTGFLGEGRFGLINDIRKEPPGRKLRTVDRFLLLAGEPGETLPVAPVPRLTAYPEKGREALRRLGGHANGHILALCPGAEYGTAKRWPAHHFARLAQDYLKHGWQVWLLGGCRDVEIAQAIQVLTGDACLDLTGHTGLLEAVDLLSLATAVVSNDSGLMHVAASLDIPLVALFGSSDPNHTPPLARRATALSLNLSCSPCFARTCPLGHLDCLEKLSPDAVEGALEQLLL